MFQKNVQIARQPSEEITACEKGTHSPSEVSGNGISMPRVNPVEKRSALSTPQAELV